MDLSLLTPDKQVKLQYWIDVIRQCKASVVLHIGNISVDFLSIHPVN